MQATILPGISMWSAWQPDRNLYFNSFFIAAADGNHAIDPLTLSEPDAAEIGAAGGIAWIVVTNRDHERDARAIATRFGAKIAASELDAPLLSGPVDRLLHDGDTIAGGRVLALDGVKTPGEFALHFPALRAVLVGDALWGTPAGALRLMPDEKLADPPRAVLSLRKLAAALPDHLLLGDGACIFGGARRILWATLEARSDAYVNKINRDEAIWLGSSGSPAPYDGDDSFEIGD
jgi:glyoxylase-like metal-dependent hydrolase (beta-lactamase superfamily II)